MAGRIQEEIKQTKPFKQLEAEAFVNLARSYEVLEKRLSDVLRPYDLSPTQYNMLRILRGAGSEGLTCSQASERMVTHDPDVTRLLDRMERKGWITRARSPKDRRIVTTCVTQAGLDLISELDEPLTQFNKTVIGHLGDEKLRTLIDLLEELRQPRT
jgi:Transcriptional regulators